MMKWRTNGKPIKIIFFPNSVRISNRITDEYTPCIVCVCTSKEKVLLCVSNTQYTLCVWCFFFPLSLSPSLSIFVQMSIYSNCCRFRWDLIIYSFSSTSFCSNIHSTTVTFDRIYSTSFLFGWAPLAIRLYKNWVYFFYVFEFGIEKKKHTEQMKCDWILFHDFYWCLDFTHFFFNFEVFVSYRTSREPKWEKLRNKHTHADI